MAIAEDNPIYQLAMKGLAGQEARLSSLLMYIEGLDGLWAGESPPDGRSYEELLEWLDDLKAEEYADFRCYLALITFMVAAAWDERYWALQAAIALSSCERASASVLHLAGLRKLANAFTDNVSFELRSLTAGLTGLFELVSLMQTYRQTHGQTHTQTHLRSETDDAAYLPIPIPEETLRRLDAGLAYTADEGRHPTLFWLLANLRVPGTRFFGTPVSTWKDFAELNEAAPQAVRDVLAANYSRIFVGIRCHSEAKHWFKTASELAQSHDDNREVLDTPGAEYLEWQLKAELKVATDAYEQGIGNALNLCNRLLTEALRRIGGKDFWGMLYPILDTAAKVQLEACRRDPRSKKEHAASARWFAVTAAWRSRRGSRDYAAAARSLLARIYEIAGEPGKARLILNQLVAKSDRLALGPLAVWSAASSLGRMSLRMGDAKSAQASCLAALRAATRHVSQQGDGRCGEIESGHRLFFADLLDNAIAACALTNDTAQAVDLWEEWYGGRQLRQRLNLAPLTETQVRHALPAGTGIAYLNTSSIGSSIHLVTPAGSQSCWVGDFALPQLKHALGPYFKSRWRLHQDPCAETAELFRDGLGLTLRSLEALASPLAELVTQHPVSRLVLIPGRGIGMIPVHATGSAGLTEESTMAHLGDRIDILYAPNATVWARATEIQRHERSASAERFFGLCFPGARHSSFAVEVERAAALRGVPGNIVLGQAATSTALWDVAHRAEILHISSHGWFSLSSSDEDPEVSADGGLVLADGDVDWRNLQKHLQLPENRLVVLSACETLSTSHRDQLNEQFGLPYAFLAAGAPLILGTSWVVEGMSTTLLVTRFHENLLRQPPLRPSAALREAQAWLKSRTATQASEALAKCFGAEHPEPLEQSPLEQSMPADRGGEGPYRHPYYWAGFRLIGADWARAT